MSTGPSLITRFPEGIGRIPRLINTVDTTPKRGHPSSIPGVERCLTPTPGLRLRRGGAPGLCRCQRRGDDAAMRACLSKGTLEAGGVQRAAAGGRLLPRRARGRGGPGHHPPPHAPVGVMEDEGPAQELPGVMIREDGEWKFDLAASQERMMSAIEGALGGACRTGLGDGPGHGRTRRGHVRGLRRRWGGRGECPLVGRRTARAGIFRTALDPRDDDAGAHQAALSSTLGFPVE